MKKCLKLKFLAPRVAPLGQVALCHLRDALTAPSVSREQRCAGVGWEISTRLPSAASPRAVFPPASSPVGLRDLHVSALGTGEGHTEGDDAGLQVAGAAQDEGASDAAASVAGRHLSGCTDTHQGSVEESEPLGWVMLAWMSPPEEGGFGLH